MLPQLAVNHLKTFTESIIFLPPSLPPSLTSSDKVVAGIRSHYYGVQLTFAKFLRMNSYEFDELSSMISTEYTQQ